MIDIDLSNLKFDSVIVKNDLHEARSKIVEPILNQAKKMGYDQQTQFALRLGLEEAMCNAFHHGNEANSSKTIATRWAFDDNCVVIYVRDEGKGFKPEKLPDPRNRENLEKPCGRGVLLMRSYMNNLSFNEKGNEVCMIKFKNGNSATS